MIDELILMAWRNLWRRKRRTWITTITIVFGVWLAMTFTGMGDYSYTNMIDTGATLGFGHVTVQPKGYQDQPTVTKFVPEIVQIKKAIQTFSKRQDPQIIDATVERVLANGVIATASKQIVGAFIGINPEQERKERNIYLKSLEQGEWLQTTDEKKVVIGRGIAELLNLKLGKKLIYTTTDMDGEIVSEVVRVKGIFFTGVKEIDNSSIILPIDTLRETLRFNSTQATMLAIFINDQRKAPAVSADINEVLNRTDIEVKSWDQTQPELANLITLDRGGNVLTQMLIGLLVAAGILNTLLMSVLERIKEFGVMMAIGMLPSSLFFLVMAESFFLAMLGLFWGVLICIPWYFYMVNVGLDFSGMMSNEMSAGGVLIDPVMKIRLYAASIVIIVLSVPGLTLLAGLYPAYKAVRTVPVESIRGV